MKLLPWLKPMLIILCSLPLLSIAQQPLPFKYLSIDDVIKIYNSKQNYVFVDVRSNGEFMDTSEFMGLRLGHIKGAINIPVSELGGRIAELRQYQNRNIIVYCSHSYRSRRASRILTDSGFANVYNMNCGMSEFYKLDKKAETYAPEMIIADTKYKPVSAPVMYKMLQENKKIQLIEIVPEINNFFDSALRDIYPLLGSFKNAAKIKKADLANKVKSFEKMKGNPVLIYSPSGGQSAEAANYLSQQGFGEVYYLFNGLLAWYDVVAEDDLNKVNASIKPYQFSNQNSFKIVSVKKACDMLKGNTKTVILDIRPDSTYNDTVYGQVHQYNHLNNSIHLAGDKLKKELATMKPDKATQYIVIDDSYAPNIKAVKYLAQSGYNVNYIPLGLKEWEWQLNNTN